MAISQRFYHPNHAHHIRTYITGHHICQMCKEGRQPTIPFQKRININTPALKKITTDIKYMPSSAEQYTYILVLLCEVTKFPNSITHKTTETADVCTAIMDGDIKYFGSPIYIIYDQDPVIMSSFAQYFFQQIGIKILTVNITNHKSLFG